MHPTLAVRIPFAPETSRRPFVQQSVQQPHHTVVDLIQSADRQHRPAADLLRLVHPCTGGQEKSLFVNRADRELGAGRVVGAR